MKLCEEATQNHGHHHKRKLGAQQEARSEPGITAADELSVGTESCRERREEEKLSRLCVRVSACVRVRACVCVCVFS